jgi:hypothetical protein
MRVVYAGDYTYLYSRPGPSPRVFLAGPTPRDADVKSWRPEAIELFRKCNFNGVLYVPEPLEGHMGKWPEYDTQCHWEQSHLSNASTILFWVPRNMKTLPGMTTNVEFGLFVTSGKVVLGYPDDAEHMKYFQYCATSYRIPIAHTLRETVLLAASRSAHRPGDLEDALGHLTDQELPPVEMSDDLLKRLSEGEDD